MRRAERTLPTGLFAVVLTATLLACAPPSVRGDDAEDRYVVVKTKKAITISGKEIDGALIVIKGGKIEAVGKKVDYPSESRVIDASELVAMPGLIDPHTRIGLPDFRRTGNKSNRRLSNLYQPPEDDTYRKLIEAGYTLLGLYPAGTGMPGQGLVLSTYAPKAKTKSGVKTEGLVRITFTRPSRDKKTLKQALKQAAEAIKKEKQATTQPAATGKPAGKPSSRPANTKGRPTSQPASTPTSAPASKPTTKPAKAKIPPELAPIIALLKKKPAFLAQVEFSRASDVIHFAQVAGNIEFPRAYLFWGRSTSDVDYVVDHALLGGADALIALQPTLPNMPLTVNRYDPAKEFTDAGCTVALFPATDSVEGHRQMRERLSLLVRAGLDRKDALKAVTLNAAKFLLVDKDYGSIEKDKKADLIFLDGDPLDPFARVRRVMIGGEMVVNLDKPRR